MRKGTKQTRYDRQLHISLSTEEDKRFLDAVDRTYGNSISERARNLIRAMFDVYCEHLKEKRK